jgi:phage tail sheath gpL-like
MSIPFQNIPQNLRVPLFYAEVDNRRANSGQFNQRALIIGQITAQGRATPNIPVISQGAADAATAGGEGSMLALMMAAYRQRDTFGEVWLLPLADDPNAVAAQGALKMESAPVAAGVLSLYIGGVRMAQPVLKNQKPARIAQTLAATINAHPSLPVTAIVEDATVKLTARNKGPAGNDVDLRLNYHGAAGGEVLPEGLNVTIEPMAGGAVAPDLTTAFANLGDALFDFIVLPYTDPASLDVVKSLLNDVSGRWAWNQQLYGHAFAAHRGALGELAALGTARNDAHTTIVGFHDSPTPAWCWAANVAGAAAVSLRADPARPLQTLALDVLAPPLASRFTLGERNTLLFDGISTCTVAQDGTVAIENLITTYQKNGLGQPDDSYLEVETLFTLAYALRRLKAVITSKYARVKLAANGTRFAPGSDIVTPNIIRADLIAQYRQLEAEGYVQNADLFKKELIVEKNAQNPNRLDVLWPGTLINQLRIFALLAQFRLS